MTYLEEYLPLNQYYSFRTQCQKEALDAERLILVLEHMLNYYCYC